MAIRNAATHLWLAGILAPFWFAGAALLAASLTPGYSPVAQVVSELGAPGMPYAGLINYGGFITTGLMVLLYSLWVRRALGPGLLARISCSLISLNGLGLLGSGLLPCDPGCPLEAASPTMIGHAVSGILTFSLSAITPLPISLLLWRRGQRSLFLAWSLLTAMALVALLALMFSPLIEGLRGLHQATFLAVFFHWLILFTLLTKGSPRRSPPAPARGTGAADPPARERPPQHAST
jgi:hypothetical membrane protein